MEFKVLFLSFDSICFAQQEDRLKTDGYFDIVLTSAPAGSEGKQWLGLQMPAKVGVLPRVVFRYLRLRVFPITPSRVLFSTALEIDDLPAVPQWLKIFLLQ